MADSLAKNPIALRQCLLYEFLQGKRAEKAFDDVSQTLGKNVMNKKGIHNLFRCFAKGKFYKNNKKHDHVNAKDIFQSDKKALCTCILYLSLKFQKKTEENRYLLHSMNSMSWHENQNLFRFNPSFVMYEEFRKVIGGDVMEFKEFDLWFYRFLNEEYDLNFERDNDKKVYELLDMPIDIMKNIVNYLDIFVRMSLAKTSRPFKEFVEDQKLFNKKLEFQINDKTTLISFDNHFIFVEKRGDNCIRRSGTGCLRDERLIQGVSHWKQGIQDFASILKLKNFYLDKLKVDFVFIHPTLYSGVQRSREPINALEDAFKSTQQLNVKKLTIDAYSMESLPYILRSFKPGYLSTIHFSVAQSELYDLEGLSFGKMGEMEQWKKAKYLTISSIWLYGSLHHFFHFKKFNVRFKTLSVLDIRQMKEILFKSPEFESCIIYVDHYFDTAIRNEFGDAIEGNPNIYHYPIPDSMDYFEINLKSNIAITRKKI